jgi:restriction system protein
LFELNGTARPVHNADVVAIVTNRALTSAAERFAAMQGIHVIDRRRLERWATYGVPWYPSGSRSILPIGEHEKACLR